MSRILWLGGSPCAGKSSVSMQLARHCGLNVYSCDEVFEQHRRSADPLRQPLLHALAQKTPEQLWLTPIKQQVRRVIDLYREEFPLIMNDLATLEPPIIAEGAALLPDCLSAAGVSPDAVLFMAPSRAFQLEHYHKREWARGVIAETSDPARAFSNWMRRDALFARWVKRRATALGFRVLVMDGSESLPATVEVAADSFGLTLESIPYGLQG